LPGAAAVRHCNMLTKLSAHRFWLYLPACRMPALRLSLPRLPHACGVLYKTGRGPDINALLGWQPVLGSLNCLFCLRLCVTCMMPTWAAGMVTYSC